MIFTTQIQGQILETLDSSKANINKNYPDLTKEVTIQTILDLF